MLPEQTTEDGWTMFLDTTFRDAVIVCASNTKFVRCRLENTQVVAQGHDLVYIGCMVVNTHRLHQDGSWVRKVFE